MNPFLHEDFVKHYSASPMTIVDVGASGGMPERWKRFKKYLRVIGFEPDECAYNKLVRLANQEGNDGVFSYVNSALYNKTAGIDFYFTKKRECSSIFIPNIKLLQEFPDAERFDVVSSIKLKTTTLDNALSEQAVSSADFIKIDTQGSELFILQGAAMTLQRGIFAVEVEIEFVNTYKDQPLFADIDKLLRQSGFMLFDLMNPVYWKRKLGMSIRGYKGQIISADALYLKSTEVFLNQIGRAKSKLFKAMSISALYGYFDYALSLCEEGFKKNILDAEEHKLITKSLRKPLHLRNPNLKSLGRNFLRSLGIMF